MVNYATVSQKESSFQRTKPYLIITCEHAGNVVPDDYKYLFEYQEHVLNSHRGYDVGALNLTMFVTRQIQVPVFIYPFTRLLIEVNRSVENKKLFSEFTNKLPCNEKELLINNYYLPYRNNIQRQLENAAAMLTGSNFVLHISVHTFTPVLDGERRTADIGILYDPASSIEHRVAALLKKQINDHDKKWIVRRNYPYLGKSDGFTTYLRKVFGTEKYCGIELEVNQKYAEHKDSNAWAVLKKTITETLRIVGSVSSS